MPRVIFVLDSKLRERGRTQFNGGGSSSPLVCIFQQWRRDTLVRFYTKPLQLLCLPHQVPLTLRKFLHRVVVLLLARTERIAEVFQIVDEAAEFVVERATSLGDICCVFLLIRESPDGSHGAQRCEQRRIRDKHNIPV